MRSTTRPTTAQCTLSQYMGFLISEPKSSTCTRLAEVTGTSHDSANRFLHREDYQPKDMFDEAAQDLCLVGGTLFVTGDTWYSCVKNLKTIKNHQTGFMFAVEKNRTVSLEKGQWEQVQNLEIPEDGLDVWLKDFGKVRLFRTMLKDQRRHYVVYLPEDVPFQRDDFTHIHDQHWQIEQYHRAIKQVCHIEHFQVRSERPVRNHIFASILSFVYLQKMQIAQVFTNIYQHQRELFKETVGAFIESFAKDKDHLLPKFTGVINA